MYWLIGGVALTLAGLTGTFMSQVEQAKYTVIEKHDAIEIRDYDPMIVAEVNVKGERKEAINQGFRMIADYIFGNNIGAQKVAMTAPVIQQPSEKIAMTAPVTQQQTGDQWKVRFVMPAGHTLDTLPKPNNSQIKLITIAKKRFAVIQFSGTSGAANLEEHTQQLQNFVVSGKFTSLSAPTYAFFNPPWTLPFLRRNEVMIEIAVH